MVLRYIAAGFAVCLLSSSAHAQCPQSLAQLVMHLVPDSLDTGPCGPSPPSCQTGVVEDSGELNQIYKAYVVLTRWQYEWSFTNDGIHDVVIGVDYDVAAGNGVDVLDFQAACYMTSSPIGDWPTPGSQLRLTFPVCVTPDNVGDPDAPLVLGWFRVVAQTPGTLTLGSSQHYVSRLNTCDQVEKLLDPVNQGVIGLGTYGLDPCSVIIDPFEGPCCLPNHTCQEGWSVACCWDQGGQRLYFMDTCADCVTPVLLQTWGKLKARYN